MKALRKIDRFYLMLAVVLITMAGLVIFTFRNIFASIGTAYEVDIEVPDSELRIDRGKLNKAYEAVVNKEIVSLEIR